MKVQACHLHGASHPQFSSTQVITEPARRIAHIDMDAFFASWELTQYRGHTIGIKLRFDNFQTVTRDMRVERATDNNLLIRRAAGQCLKRAPLDRRIRLLGVRVSGLKSAAAAEEKFSEQGSFEFD